MFINLTKNRTVYLFTGIRFILLSVLGWDSGAGGSIQVCAPVHVCICGLTVRGWGAK